MPSFLDLPPEIRMAVYNILLGSCLSNNTRILYTGHTSFWWRRRIIQPYKIGPEGHIEFSASHCASAVKIEHDDVNIHLANIDDLLFLASTCRLLRSELLALAWSNADIYIRSPHLSREVSCVFLDNLPSNVCVFVRTLQIQIDHDTWSSQKLKQIAGLVLHRLPQLEHLTVNITLKLSTALLAMQRCRIAVAGLSILPLRIAVKMHHYFDPTAPAWLTLYDNHQRRRDIPGVWDEYTHRRLHALRVESDRIRQKRSKEQAEKKQKDYQGDILEATAEIRSLMVG